MEILFRDKDCLFYILDGKILKGTPNDYPDIDISNIPHLDDIEVLYHYKDKRNIRYPVYYEYKGVYVSKLGSIFYILPIGNSKRDYTLSNLKLL